MRQVPKNGNQRAGYKDGPLVRFLLIVRALVDRIAGEEAGGDETGYAGREQRSHA